MMMILAMTQIIEWRETWAFCLGRTWFLQVIFIDYHPTTLTGLYHVPVR